MLIALLVFALPLVYAVVTSQVWEDYYITFRVSRNLVEGKGLVYQPGERVHVFTSPLGVLAPALGYFLTRNDDLTIWFLRVVSAVALAGAALLLMNSARDQQVRPAALGLALALAFLDAKVVAFSANGMETAFLILFATLTWRELTRQMAPRWPLLAVGYAGLMWTRPDAFLLAGALTFSWWIFGPRSVAANERAWWRRVILAALVGGAAYAPWFFWAWSYYGSPIPNTILAKSAISPDGLSWLRIAAAPLRCLTDPTAMDGLFAPSFYAIHGWPEDFVAICRLLARLSAILWVIPSLPRVARAASFSVLIGGVYLHQVMAYPWYLPPWTLLGGIAIAGLFARETVGAANDVRRSARRVIMVLIAVLPVAVLSGELQTARVEQHVIENQGRAAVGRWLKAESKPADTVFLEPLGYIGYFSQLKMLDYPGLASPEVSRLVRAGKKDYGTLIAELKPTWVVVRPGEYYFQQLNKGAGLQAYTLVRVFSVRSQIDEVPVLPGRRWLEYDAEYMVFHRRNEARGDGAETKASGASGG
jgi:hypothetical protein